MVTWVLEQDLFGDGNVERIATHVRGLGLKAHQIRVIPIVHEIEGRVPRIDGPVVFYGSIGAQAVCSRHGWSPGVWTGEGLSERVAKERLGDLYLNADAVVVPLSKVADVAPDLMFLKPNGDTKEFAGKILAREEVAPWHAEMLAIGYLDGTDFEVVVSSVKDIGSEHRLVVVDGKVLTATLYRQGVRSRRIDVDPAPFQDFVDLAESRHRPADVYVMDVTTLDGAPKVIEYNTFNSAGIYSKSVEVIVDAVTAHVEHAHRPDLTDGEAPPTHLGGP